jgi:two-component system phosphate regulon sensor histidine kinase PhoR
MFLNSHALALLCGVTIATITTAFLSLLPDISNTALVVTFTLSFSSGFILVRIIAEFLFFREIDNIQNALKNLQDIEINSLSGQRRAYFNPLRKINKEIKGYLDKKQEEIDELRRMETFRREFIADVSHELKTPIFAAQGFVHTLLDGAVEDKKVRSKFLKKAAKSLDGLDILVQDLLTISQMETGEIRMHFENFDISEMCREVIEQLEDKAQKKKIHLKLEEDYQEFYVYADFQRIYQVLINLISNAIKYTKKDGKVDISIKELGQKVEVMVRDTGRGIPEEHLTRIFERFYRVDKSRSKEKGGTGLGLAIVKHIMEGHGSKVEVSSKLGEGSSFWFTLDKCKTGPRMVWEDEEDEEIGNQST